MRRQTKSSIYLSLVIADILECHAGDQIVFSLYTHIKC